MKRSQPSGFDWLWAPLERSIRNVLDDWKPEHYRLRRDVAFQVELSLEQFMVDGHLTCPECEEEGRKVDLFIDLPEPFAAIDVHFNGGPNWMPSSVDAEDLEKDFEHISKMTKDGKTQAGLVLIFDENFYPEMPPNFEKASEDIAPALGFKYNRMATDKVLCHIWWICGSGQ